MAVFKRGKFYWFAFMFDGERVQKSTKQTNKDAAKNIESAYRTMLAKGEVGIREKRVSRSVTVNELLDAKLASYVEKGTATAANRSQIKKAKKYFGSKLAARLTEDDLNAYVEHRIAAGDANGTINRLTDLVRSAFRDASLEPPRARKLSEQDNVRTGFFSPTEFAAVCAHLPDWLRDFAEFAHSTGWRAGSIRKLKWEDIDLAENEIDLPGRSTKTKKPLKMPLEGELAALIAKRKELRVVKRENGSEISSLVFHRDGAPIVQSMYRHPWRVACMRAGVGEITCSKCHARVETTWHCAKTTTYSGRLIHDLRRTAARDLIRSGTAQSVAMKITGHKTNSMFIRYNITDTDDIREALRAACARIAAREGRKSSRSQKRSEVTTKSTTFASRNSQLIDSTSVRALSFRFNLRMQVRLNAYSELRRAANCTFIGNVSIK